jgi:hypothetical protein
MVIVEEKEKLYGSKAWANDKLRFGIRQILGDPRSSRFVSETVFLVELLQSDLSRHGYWKQAQILGFHLHFWLKKQKRSSVAVHGDPEIADTSSREERRPS